MFGLPVKDVGKTEHKMLGVCIDMHVQLDPNVFGQGTFIDKESSNVLFEYC